MESSLYSNQQHLARAVLALPGGEVLFDGGGYYYPTVGKLGADGALEWAKWNWIGGGSLMGEDYPKLLLTSEGNVLLVRTQDYSYQRMAAALLGQSGEALWYKVYIFMGGNYASWALDAAEAADGGFLIGGYYNWQDEDENIMALLKVDQSGVYQWARKLEKAGEVYIHGYVKSVFHLPAGGFLCLAYLDILGKERAAVFKLSEDGEVQWFKGLDLRDVRYWPRDWARVEGGFLVACTRLGDYGNYSALVIKLRDDGSVVWARGFGVKGQQTDTVSVQPTSDGGFVVLTNAEVLDDDWHPVFFKFNTYGHLQWVRYLPEDGLTAEAMVPVWERGVKGFSVVGEQVTPSGYRRGFVLKLTEDLNYPSCELRNIPAEFLFEYNLSVNATPKDVQGESARLEKAVNWSVDDLSAYRVNICSPLWQGCEGSGGRGGRRWRPAPGGAVIYSPERGSLSLYSATGALVRRVSPSSGENFVPLKPEVYLSRLGKLVVR